MVILGMHGLDEFNAEFARARTIEEDEAILKIRHLNDCTRPMVTLPACASREDFERIKKEMQAALEWAEHRGEQRALAFLLGWGVPPVKGILRQSESSDAPIGEQ